jgi:hypothetical protein
MQFQRGEYGFQAMTDLFSMKHTQKTRKSPVFDFKTHTSQHKLSIKSNLLYLRIPQNKEMYPTHSIRHTMTVAFATGLIMLSPSTSDAFTTPSSSSLSPSLSSSSLIGGRTTPHTPLQSHQMMEEVSDFYATYPVQSAVLTCGVKASIADGIAQVKAVTAAAASPNQENISLEAKRNVAYIIYGGIFIGLMCHMEYDYVFPQIFGNDHNIQTIVPKILFDVFISGPLLWLPPAYFIKAILYDYPLKEGLQKYVTDVVDNGLLIKYWQIWLPAQTISFSLIPDHMRVAFMAFISFFWFILFSSVSADSNDETETLPANE